MDNHFFSGFIDELLKLAGEQDDRARLQANVDRAYKKMKSGRGLRDLNRKSWMAAKRTLSTYDKGQYKTRGGSTIISSDLPTRTPKPRTVQGPKPLPSVRPAIKPPPTTTGGGGWFKSRSQLKPPPKTVTPKPIIPKPKATGRSWINT